MKKIAIGLLGLVVLLVAAVVVVPRVIDWNGYKSDIAQAVKDATGRDLVIAGDIEVAILPGVSFGLRDVSLSNAAGAGEPKMFTLESVSGKLALLPLIFRNVVVEELVVRRPVLHLEISGDGRPNWVFEGAEPAAVQPAPADEGLPISDLTLGDVRLEEGRVTYSDARVGQKVVAEAIAFRAALADFSAPFTLDGDLTLNGEPVGLKVALDSPGGLLAGDRAAVRAALEAAKVTIAYDGGLRQKPVANLDGTFDLAVPSVGALAAWLERPLADGQPDPGPLKVHAVFAGEGARMTLTEAIIEGEALQAKATGGFDGSGAVKRLTFNLEAGVLDLDRYLPPPVATPVADGHAMAKSEKGQTNDPLALIPDEPFDLAPLRETEAEIRITIGGVKAMGYRVGKIGFDGSLKGGVLAANLTELRLYGGNVTGKLALDGSGEGLAADTELAVAKVNVGALARAAEGDQAKIAGIATGRVKATGSGASPRALVQSLVAGASLSLGGVKVKDAPGKLSKLDLALDLPGVDASPTIKGSLVYNKVPVAFTLGLEPLGKVLSSDRFTVKLAVKSKRLNLSYDGAVQAEPVPGLDGKFGLNVPSVRRLLAWLEMPLPKGQPDPGRLTVTANLRADGAKSVIEAATIKGKNLNAKASGSFERSGATTKIALDVEAGVLDIDRYLPRQAKASKGGKAAAGAPSGDPLAALPVEPFDLAALRQTEAAVSIRLGGVKAMGYRLGKTVIAANLAGGVLEATIKELQLYSGTVTGSVKLDGAGDALAVNSGLTIAKLDIGALAKAAQGKSAKLAGRVSASLRAKGAGKHPRALVENLVAKAELNLDGIDLRKIGGGVLSKGSVVVDLPGFDRPAALTGSVVYNKQKASVDIALAPLRQVLSDQPFDLTAALTSDLVAARYGGKVQRQPVPGLDGNFDLDVPSLGKLAAWLGQPLDPAQPDPGPLKVKAVLRADGTKIALDQATIDGKALKAKATASVDTADPVTRFDANVEIVEADLNAYLPPQSDKPKPAKRAAAGPSSWSEEPIDVSALRQAEGRATVKIGRVRYGEVDIENGTATVTLKKGVLKATVAKLGLAGGTVDLDATVNGAGKTPAIGYKVAVAGVQARPVLKTFAGSDRLSGTAIFHASGQARGGNQLRLVRSLNGQGRFVFRDGAIHGMNIAAALRNAQNLSFSQTGEQKTDFAELSGSFTIVNGLLENRDLRMIAPLVRLAGAGQVPLPPRLVDYRVEAKLVASLQGQGSKDALAGLPIPVTAKGSWDDPAIGVDWKSVFAAAAQDPERIANMPNDLVNLGQSLGVNLGLPGSGDSDSGGLLGGLLKAIPGLGGDDKTGQQEEDSGSTSNPLKSLQKLLGN